MDTWTKQQKSEHMAKIAMALHDGMSAEKKRERAMKMVEARRAKKKLHEKTIQVDEGIQAPVL